MINKLLSLCLFSLMALATACNPYGEDAYREIIVVESYLIANQPLPLIRLSKTLPLEEPYSFDAAAVTGASVTVELQAESGQGVEESFSYIMPQAGIYVPENQGHTVQPGRTYRLSVTGIPGHGHLEAATRVPAQFHVLSEVPDQLTYQGDQLEITISPNTNPGRQNTYVFTTIADDPREENLTPLYAGLIDNDVLELSSLTKNSSGLINEENFGINQDGSIDLTYPWIAVAFYGISDIVANSLDTNIIDFIRSQDIQGGGSTLSPGEIPNAIYHVDGGIGVFGSASADTITVNIRRE